MPVDLTYGKRTGVTSFKSDVAELCETLAKFQPLITAWVNSTVSDPNKSLILALVAAINAACAAVKAMPDD